MSVLLLNASYEPLTVVSWKRAMTLVISGRAEMVEQAGDRIVRSAGGAEFPLPQVVRLMQMVTFAGMRAHRPSIETFYIEMDSFERKDRQSCQN